MTVGDDWRGSWICLRTLVRHSETTEEFPIYALGWADKKLKMFAATRGSTLPGNPSIRPRDRIDLVNGNRTTVHYERVVKRPKMVEQIYTYFSAIDIHNHYRQGTLALEETWGTHCWWHRIFSTILGMIATDAYFMYRLEFDNVEHDQSRLSFLDFTALMAGELIKNTYLQDQGPHLRRRQRDLQNDESDEDETDIHTLKALRKLPYYADTAGPQRRCCWKHCRDVTAGSNRSHKTAYYCHDCSPSDMLQRRKPQTLDGIKCFCNPTTERNCFLEHIREL